MWNRAKASTSTRASITSQNFVASFLGGSKPACRQTGFSLPGAWKGSDVKACCPCLLDLSLRRRRGVFRFSSPRSLRLCGEAFSPLPGSPETAPIVNTLPAAPSAVVKPLAFLAPLSRIALRYVNIYH